MFSGCQSLGLSNCMHGPLPGSTPPDYFQNPGPGQHSFLAPSAHNQMCMASSTMGMLPSPGYGFNHGMTSPQYSPSCSTWPFQSASSTSSTYNPYTSPVASSSYNNFGYNSSCYSNFGPPCSTSSTSSVTSSRPMYEKGAGTQALRAHFLARADPLATWNSLKEGILGRGQQPDQATPPLSSASLG